MQVFTLFALRNALRTTQSLYSNQQKWAFLISLHLPFGVLIGQMSTTYEEQTRHSITMHVENLVFFALYWTDSIQLSLCILACSEPHNEDVERRQILKLSSTNSEMKSIYKHHLKLHLIWALGQDNFSVQDFLSRALDFVPVGISVGSDLLFAYRTEIKISWIKLFVFQFRTFLTGWISSSPAQSAMQFASL